MYNQSYNHACNYLTVHYQQIVHGNVANQIHGFTIDYGKCILKRKKVVGEAWKVSEIEKRE